MQHNHLLHPELKFRDRVLWYSSNLVHLPIDRIWGKLLSHSGNFHGNIGVGGGGYGSHGANEMMMM